MLHQNENIFVEQTKDYSVSGIRNRLFRQKFKVTETRSKQSNQLCLRSASLPGSLGRQDFSCFRVGIGSVADQCNALNTLSKRIQALISTHICYSSNVHNNKCCIKTACLYMYREKQTSPKLNCGTYQRWSVVTKKSELSK